MEKEKFLSSVYLIIRNNEGKILLQRRQGTKLWCGFLALPAGHIDENKSPYEAVIREAKEESGSDITADDIISLGKVMVSTQSNQFCHLYLVTVNADKMGETDPQNEIEAEATLEWFNLEDAFNYEDWKLITIIAKAKARNDI